MIAFVDNSNINVDDVTLFKYFFGGGNAMTNNMVYRCAYGLRKASVT